MISPIRPHTVAIVKRLRQTSVVAVTLLLSFCLFGNPTASAADRPQAESPAASEPNACRVLASEQLEEPIRAIANEYARRSGTRIALRFLPAAEIDSLVRKHETKSDVVFCMAKDKNGKASVSLLSGVTTVAWKYPSGEPVWGAALTGIGGAQGLVRFAGGPAGHRLWADSKAGFTITSGKTHAEAFAWVAENRVKQTYPLTAVRMLREIGGIRDGVCIDIGCGPGHLDIELARRSNFKITGLDIDADMKPLFEENARKAGLEDRLRFVIGDAQSLPFPDNSADVILSRGTLVFIPDIAKCLREVDRVLKPTGVAFLGGRYLYTPHKHKISNEALEEIVRASGVPGAKVVSHRGQWVKIIGPKAPKAARQFQGGPPMLIQRCIADYGVTKGACLLICTNDGEGTQGMQQNLLDITEFAVTALYPKKEIAEGAAERIAKAKLAGRITCAAGTLKDLPFDDASFDLVIGTGPVLIWGDRRTKMRELYRVLRPGGAALVGGRYLGMPDFRKVSSDTLRADAKKTGITSIRVLDDGGQWVEVMKE